MFVWIKSRGSKVIKQRIEQKEKELFLHLLCWSFWLKSKATNRALNRLNLHWCSQIDQVQMNDNEGRMLSSFFLWASEWTRTMQIWWCSWGCRNSDGLFFVSVLTVVQSSVVAFFLSSLGAMVPASGLALVPCKVVCPRANYTQHWSIGGNRVE